MGFEKVFCCCPGDVVSKMSTNQLIILTFSFPLQSLRDKQKALRESHAPNMKQMKMWSVSTDVIIYLLHVDIHLINRYHVQKERTKFSYHAKFEGKGVETFFRQCIQKLVQLQTFVWLGGIFCHHSHTRIQYHSIFDKLFSCLLQLLNGTVAVNL